MGCELHIMWVRALLRQLGTQEQIHLSLYLESETFRELFGA